MLLLMPALLMAQPECGLGLLDRLEIGMQRTAFDSIVRAEPCGFTRPAVATEYAYPAEYARPGLESLPDPSAFRVDLVEYRTYIYDGAVDQRDTHDVDAIILKGRRLGRDRAELVPLHMRSLINTLIERFGPPAYPYSDELVAAVPVAVSDGDETRAFAQVYAHWKFHGQRLVVYLMRSYNGWQIEVRLEESDPQPKG
jgi:hypothetical protein